MVLPTYYISVERVFNAAGDGILVVYKSVASYSENHNSARSAEQGKYRMYNIYGFYALEAVFFISGKCTDEQINKIDCRARAYYAEKSWNEFVPERIDICYPAVCPCCTAQKYCGADAEHKARVGESAGIYRASDFFEKFYIRAPCGSFYINCSVTYRYILSSGI